MINNKPRELTLIYHSEKMDDRKALVFVEALNGYAIKSLDLAKERLTATQLAEIAYKMHAGIHDLLDDTFVEKPAKINKEQVDSLADADLLTVLEENPHLIVTPLVIIGDRAYKYGSAYELVKKDLDRYGGKSEEKTNLQEIDRGR